MIPVPNRERCFHRCPTRIPAHKRRNIMQRRTFLSSTAVTSLGLAAVRSVASAQASQAQESGPVSLRWLDGTAPLVPTGVSWGVPWPRGAFRRDQVFNLAAADGASLPLQTWPLAYWPDGSLKWSGMATVAAAAGPFRLSPASSADQTAHAVEVRQSADAIDVDLGSMQCRVPRQGAAFIDSMRVEGRVVARTARLVCTLEDRANPDVIQLTHFESSIRKVTAEQTGP